MRILPLLAAALCLLLPVVSLAEEPMPTVSHHQAVKRVKTGVKTMQQWYRRQTGQYATTGWWNSANAITVLVDSMRVTGSRHDRAVLANTLRQAQIVIPRAQQTGELHGVTGAPGFLNDYYDDEGWWALAWIDAYDLTGEGQYLAMSQSIFQDMTGGWDATCGGGLWWSKDRTYKAAIENELFLSVAAHLATRAGDAAQRSQYSAWAAKEWSWFSQSGMINSDNLVNDGLRIDKADGSCRNNGKTTWTYNQGVILGGLAEYAKTSNDPALLATAKKIADAATTRLVDSNGVLHESCEPNCGGDGIQFKGIFVRNLRALDEALHDPHYATFFATNANAIWTEGQGPDHQFSVVWSGPFASPNAGTQASALDALISAAAVPPRSTPAP